MAIKRVSAEEAKKLKGRTKWEEIDKLTDEQIDEAARCDPDSALPSDEELRDFRPAKVRRKAKRTDGQPKSKSDEANGMRGATDWRKVKALTDAEIRSAAHADPDARELSAEELVRFRRKKVATQAS